MSLFSSSNEELSSEQCAKINEILPEKYQKDTWISKDIFGSNGLIDSLRTERLNKQNEIIKIKDNITHAKSTSGSLEAISSHIRLFNTELFNAEPLGLIDIGIVSKFAAASSGDRFAAGAIGYAIENAADETYAKSGFQEKAVSDAKMALMKKARSIYPECNVIFKYDIDFRELGSSGNVFIYLRGTACKGENPALEKAELDYHTAIEADENKLTSLSREIDQLNEIVSKLPSAKKDLVHF